MVTAWTLWQRICLPLVTYRNVKILLTALLLMSGVFLVFVAITETITLNSKSTDDVPDLAAETSYKRRRIAEATDVSNTRLHYGIVIDCGSSGSRVFVYFWPPHDGNPKELLNIEQMRDANAQQVIKKIEPGISEFVNKPSQASDYITPLLKFAADHIPAAKHKETPVYIMATAGMRMLKQSDQDAILDDLRVDIPLQFDFLFSPTHVEVISGKQEGVYAWIGVNYALHKFDHVVGDDPMVVANPVGGDSQEIHMRKRTVGMIDMGGGSVQIAYEVPNTEDVAKSLLAEFNLGCSESDTGHTYRVYVTTFLGYGGNIARTKYEALMINSQLTTTQNQSPFKSDMSILTVINNAPLQKENVIQDPCLPLDMIDEVTYQGISYYFKGTGNFDKCKELQKPLLNESVSCMKAPCSINGVFQPPIDMSNSEFYGFSEFYYSMEDVLRMAGKYNYGEFRAAAQQYCGTKWETLQDWYKRNLFPKADSNRFRLQCFKSAWIANVFHNGFHFPMDYPHFVSTQLINDQEVQWTLGALVFKTRFFPLREIEKYDSRNSKARASWELELQHSYYLLVICVSIVVCAIFVYLRRLRIVRRPDLSKVPTMAYFMTEEGQISEGLVVNRSQTLPAYDSYMGDNTRYSEHYYSYGGDSKDSQLPSNSTLFYEQSGGSYNSDNYYNKGFKVGKGSFTSSRYYDYSGS